MQTNRQAVAISGVRCGQVGKDHLRVEVAGWSGNEEGLLPVTLSITPEGSVADEDNFETILDLNEMQARALAFAILAALKWAQTGNNSK